MLIKTTDMCRTYRNADNKVQALFNINLSIEKGEFAAITGASGSGKSTLMNILGMLDLPDKGSYFFENTAVSDLSDKELSEIRGRKIGFIFQSFNLIPSLTTVENVMLPLGYRKLPKKERIVRATAALDAVGLSHRLTHRPTQLSGGQQQRVAIARAIASDPELILADEPCGNLDSHSGEEVMDMLAELNKNGKTVVLITHDNKAARRCNKIYEVADGKLSLIRDC